MKKRFLSYLVAICMVCLLTMTSCSAAEVPAAGSGTNPGSAKLTSESQAMSPAGPSSDQSPPFPPGTPLCNSPLNPKP